MNAQKINGDWYALSGELEPIAKLLHPVPGVRFLESAQGLESIEIHISHLPLLPPAVREVCLSSPLGLGTQPPSPMPRGLLPSLNFRPSFKLREYQLDAIKFARERKGSLFLHGLGLGKTVMASCCVESPSMAVVPSAAIQVWHDEASAMGMRVEILRGKAVDKEKVMSGADLFITTYGSAGHWTPYFKPLSYGPSIKTLILDEAHYVHRKGLQWVKALDSLPRERTIAATNTPARNHLLSLYGVLSSLQHTPRPWGSVWDFRRRYCGAYQTEYGWEDTEPTNTEELTERMTEVAISVDWNSPEVFGLRPQHSRDMLPIHITRMQLADMSAQALKDSVRNGKQHAIVWLSNQRKLLGEVKLSYITSTPTNPNNTNRTIWWCWHKNIASKLAKHFKKHEGCPVDLVTGSTAESSRKRILHEWKYGDPHERGILVATLASMSAACNLVTADKAVFLEYDWAPLNMIQAEKRHHRPGNQHTRVETIYYYIQRSHEQYMLSYVLDKIREQELVIPSVGQADQIEAILGRTTQSSCVDVLDDIAKEIQ